MSQRDDAREILRELLNEALAVPNGNGTDGAIPQVPAPPVAAVLRPSNWTGPSTGGEVIGGGPQTGVECVSLGSDEDLDRFVRTLLARFENPREREAIRAGRLRFTLDRGAGAGGAAAGIVRVERGAVTERKVDEAAKAGARLVLGPGAVLTPLAREKARAKGIEIERER
jgi:hypothetical protein